MKKITPLWCEDCRLVCFETGLGKPILTLNDPNGFKNTTNVHSIHLELRMALSCQISAGKWKYVNPCLDFLGIPDQRTAYVKQQVRPGWAYVRRSCKCYPRPVYGSLARQARFYFSSAICIIVVWRRHVWSRSTLVQLMACYLNHYWLNISEIYWHAHTPEGNFTEMFKVSVLDVSLKIAYLKLKPPLPGANESTIYRGNDVSLRGICPVRS